MTPGEVLKLRKSTGLSQVQFARKIGVSVNSLINWETGRTAPRPEMERRLRSGASGTSISTASLIDTYSKPLPPVDSAGTGQAPATLKDDFGTAVKPPVQQNQEIPAAEDPAVMRGSFSALLDALDGIRRAVNQLAAKIDGAEALEARIRLLERDMDRMRGHLDRLKGAA